MLVHVHEKTELMARFLDERGVGHAVGGTHGERAEGGADDVELGPDGVVLAAERVDGVARRQVDRRRRDQDLPDGL